MLVPRGRGGERGISTELVPSPPSHPFFLTFPLQIVDRKGNAIENSPPPLPSPSSSSSSRLWNGWISLCPRSDETFSCKKKKKKRKTNEKRRKRERKGKKVNRGTRFVTKGCKVRARGRYSPRCELWFTVLATVEWKAFRRKPTADCIPYIQEAD